MRRLMTAAEDAQKIDNGVDSLHRLVDTLLGVSKLESGLFPVLLSPFDPRKLIRNVVRDHLRYSHVPVQYRISPEIPLVVVAD